MAEAAATTNEKKETPVQRKFREESETNLFDYLKSLATETPIKVAVIRELPATWEGRNIAGTLDSFEDPISEEEIRDLYGGGKYKLVIYAPNEKGSWQYATARKLKIAGDPKLDSLITTGPNARGEDPSVVRDAMRMSQQMINRAQERADRAEQHGPDPATQLVMEELRAARREAAAKDDKLFELATKDSTGATDMLLGKMLDGESARMQGLRQQVESELRMKNDMHKAEIDRLHTRYEDIARRQEEAHKREVDNLVRAHDNQTTILKTSYDSQLEGVKRELSHLGRQLTVAQSEVAELRAKKDRSLLDTMTEMAAVKDAMETFSGKSEDSGGSTAERIINGLLGSSLAEGVAARIAGAPEGMGELSAPPQEEPEIPINEPVQLPDGRIIVRRADGSVVELRRKPRPPKPTGEVGVEVSDEDIAVALQFMESALAGDADPAEFARTARNLVPSLTQGPLQELLRTQGVDAFLVRVAKLSPGSPLLQQHGKNWTRKVAAVLLES